MQLKRTVKLKLEVDLQSVLPTIDSVTKAFNYICDVGWNDQEFDSYSLQKKTYRTIREYLPSQLTCSTTKKASESLKAAIHKKRKNLKVSKPQSKFCSIRYDSCSFNVWFDRNELSISTISGRLKCKFKVADCFKQYLSWRRRSAELFIRKNKIFLNIAFYKDFEDFEPQVNPYILGVDRGINRIAVCSNNKFFSGAQLKRVKRKYRLIRSKLQSKYNSQSAKRHLKKLSLRENRFTTHVNHKISKEIVKSVPEGSIIVLEDLKKYRERIKKEYPDKNRKLNSWSYGQLESFLIYKAESKGILVDYTGAHYTSQKCSRCGHRESENRHRALFKCQKCGCSLNADLNAARNIELNYRDAKGYLCGLSVNQPIVSGRKDLDTNHLMFKVIVDPAGIVDKSDSNYLMKDSDKSVD